MDEPATVSRIATPRIDFRIIRKVSVELKDFIGSGVMTVKVPVFCGDIFITALQN
jgi:hypothetical protein